MARFRFLHHWQLYFLTAILVPALASATAVPAKPSVIRIVVPDTSAGSSPSDGPVVDSLRQRHLLEQAFAPKGITIRWSFLKGAGPAVNEAFASGQVDFAFLGDLPALIGRASGLDTRLLAAAERGHNSYLAARIDSGIHQLADLQGKRVAVFHGTASQLSLDAALASAGLKESDLRLINMDWNSAAAAVSAKAVDAAWLGVSAYALAQKGLATVPLNTKTTPHHAGVSASILVASGAFVDHYPELTQRLLATVVRNAAQNRDSAQLDGLLRLSSQQGHWPLALLHREYADTNLHFRFSPRLDPYLLNYLSQDLALAQQAHLIRKSFAVASWAQPQLLEAALKETKTEHIWPAYPANASPDGH